MAGMNERDKRDLFDMWNSDWPVPHEPSGNARKGAQAMRELFLAYVAVGFTPAEAIQLIIGMVGATMQGRDLDKG
jgi:hypothetical protein